MSTIFLALSQHSHFSDVLRSNFLGAMVERFKVVVLTTVIDEALARSHGFRRDPNIAYVKLPLTYEKMWMIFDKYLRVPLIRELDHLTYMKFFYRRDHWWPRKLLMCGRIFLPKRLITMDRLTRWEMRRAKPSPEFIDLVRRHRPVLLVTATPGFKPFEAEMIAFTKALGIPSVAVDLNYDNLTSTGKLIRKTDYLAVWNELMKSEAETLHRYPDRRLGIVGCLRFDHYFYDEKDPRFPSREDFLRAKSLDPGRRTVVFAGPTPSNYPPRRDFIFALLELKRRRRLDGDPNILVRVHPNDGLETYREFVAIPGVRFESASHKVDFDNPGARVEMDENDLTNLTATLKYADVVLNFASTVAIEACIFDRPVINIAFPDYRRIVYQFEYNKYIVDTKAVRLANDPEELAALINLYLARPEIDRAERAKLVADFIPFRDGANWRRAADFVSAVAARSR